MCGIVGLLNKDGRPIDQDRLIQANNTMINRGPDDAGYYTQGSFGMAMRRLSIIGVNNGKQPISSNDNSIHLIMNGEIYNYLELKQSLQTKGYQFKTDSDAEVLVYLYQEYGMDAVSYLNGMFAFALWDENKKRLWIGRDRIGIKPLFYINTSDSLSFASTLDAITKLPRVSKKIDQESLMLYLSLGYVPSPRSIYQGIKKLNPGHWLCYDEAGIKIKQYWKIKPSDTVKSNDDFVEQLDYLINDSIRLRSRSDVEVGTFLSGGIDSSTVTAYYCQKKSGGVHTFLADFAGKESEAYYANLVANRYDTQHHTVPLTWPKACSELDGLMDYLDEPISDSAIIPCYSLSKCARSQNLRVMLSGAGGDELFGGYDRYYQTKKSFFAGKVPISKHGVDFLGSLHPRIHHALGVIRNEQVYFGLSTSGVNLGILHNLYLRKKDYHHAVELLDKTLGFYKTARSKYGYAYGGMLTDIGSYLVDNILSLQDKTSMAASIEARVPLLDHRIVSHAFSALPSVNLGIDRSNKKRSLKKIAKKYLPKEIIDRKKLGFNAPVHSWVAQESDYFMKSIQEKTSPLINDMLDVDGFIKRCQSSKYRALASETVFSLYVFNKWYNKHA